MKKRVIVGISGASGAIYGFKIVELLKNLGNIETHLVLSSAACTTLKLEIGSNAVQQLCAMVSQSHTINDFTSSIASGSFKTDGMIVAPCSIRTLSSIAYGNTDNLLIRAADVTLKERRPLVLMVRDSPLHAGHIKSMLLATESGAIIAPPVPAFYTNPKRIDDIVTQTAGRAIELIGIDMENLIKRWQTFPEASFANSSIKIEDLDRTLSHEMDTALQSQDHNARIRRKEKE